MPGYTKNMYNKDIENMKKEFSGYIRELMQVLPKNYDFKNILEVLKEYYPFEWQILNEKYQSYCVSDKKLKSLGRKVRFSMETPVEFLQSLTICSKIMSEKYKKEYDSKFEEHIQQENREKLGKKRNFKINKRREKIEKAKIRAQEVEPNFLDILMGLYDKKNTSQKDKVYIMKELQKYYCPKVISFFKRKVHSEYNRQLREIAFYHLQELGHYVILRRQKYMKIPSNNKKRRKYLRDVYANEKYNISEIPEELEYRIQNSKEQKIKNYDFFISHSSSDYKEVQWLIQSLNKDKKNVYCDWINDMDYLKRELVGKATLSVIEKRLEQSKAVIFVSSKTSMKSIWVKYELNYFHEFKKPIYVINREDISVGKLKWKKMIDLWFLDDNYRNIDLFPVV